MNETIILIIIFVLIVVVLEYNKCDCGCFKWCVCKLHNTHGYCCCTQRETIINKTRLITINTNKLSPHNLYPIWDDVKKKLFKHNIGVEVLNNSTSASPNIIMIDEHGKSHTYKGPNQIEDIVTWALGPVILDTSS